MDPRTATDYSLASPLDVDEDGSFTINQLKRGSSDAPFERFSETVREYVALFLSSTFLIAFMAFVIAICAMDKVNKMGGGGPHGPDDHWKMRCQNLGTATYGDDVFSYGGHHYQVVGGHWAKLTWRMAEMDAWSRCYKGKVGKLAMVNSAEENEMLVAKLHAHGGYSSVGGGDAAWLGGADLETEGTWQWLGDSGSYAGETFLKGNVPYKGAYNNFRAGEPNNNGEEDCLKMDPDGQWVDDSCYKQYQYFFVEFEK